jgi:hypothetical protein
MAVLSWTTEVTGFEGIIPHLVYINTNDTFATITATGYLNPSVEAGMSFTNGEMALVMSTSGPLWLQGELVGTNYNLVSPANTPGVVLPTIANHIATFTNTIGTLGEDASTAINGGNIQAGLSGTAGSLVSFPGTAANGSLLITAVNNVGNHTSTISSVTALGQNTVYTLTDPGAATAKFVLNTGATTMAVGSKIVLDKGTGTTSSFAVTISKNSGVITTEALSTAGGASQAVTLTNTVIATTSVILCQVLGGTNTTQNFTLVAVPGAGSAVITIYNNTAATALNGTLIIGFTVF